MGLKETKAIYGVLDSVREVAASPVQWISTSALLVPEGRHLLQQPARSRGAWSLAMDAPFQSVPKTAGVRPALKQYAQLWCVPLWPGRGTAWWVCWCWRATGGQGWYKRLFQNSSLLWKTDDNKWKSHWVPWLMCLFFFSFFRKVKPLEMAPFNFLAKRWF